VQELLTTAPDVAGGTHWGQLTFQLHPPLHAEPGDTIHCKFQLVRQPQNNRLLHVRMALTLESQSGESTTSNHMYKVD
jgi:type I protein arginine methyltransferase